MAISNDKKLAYGLGGFSIGLGLAEIFTPGVVAKLIGVPERRGLLRMMGMREIAAGICIFTQRTSS